MPEATDWKALGELQGQKLRQLFSRDFLNRLKLEGDLTGACQSRVQKDKNGTKGPQAEFDAALECKGCIELYGNSALLATIEDSKSLFVGVDFEHLRK